MRIAPRVACPLRGHRSQEARAASARLGLTLLELVVVMAILVVLAGIMVGRGDVVASQAKETTTRVSLSTLREAISDQGYQPDVGHLPLYMADLFVKPAGDPPFDPLTGRGWNGPYLVRWTGKYQVDGARRFTLLYGNNGDPAALDAWGRPIVLQIPITAATPEEQAAFTRLVSAGLDGILQTNPNDLAPDILNEGAVGDDLVLYLYRSNGP